MNDGRAMLNCACGITSHPEWNNVDFFPYARLKQHPLLVRFVKGIGFLSETRLERLSSVDPHILYWDLRKGIPYENNTFDVVYHSHFMEHLPRAGAFQFLKDCYRVLLPGGTLRVVVPDLELLANQYLCTLSQLKTPGNGGGRNILDEHLHNIDHLLGQMAELRESGIREQTRVVRYAERFVRGEAKGTRELERHRWMYDRFSLGRALQDAGFVNIRAEQGLTSRIEGWGRFNLDTDKDGNVRKADSLFIEASRSLT